VISLSITTGDSLVWHKSYIGLMLLGDRKVGGCMVSATAVDLPARVWPVTTGRTGENGDEFPVEVDGDHSEDMASMVSQVSRALLYLRCSTVIPQGYRLNGDGSGG
jgi:hypothetical protein